MSQASFQCQDGVVFCRWMVTQVVVGVYMARPVMVRLVSLMQADKPVAFLA